MKDKCREAWDRFEEEPFFTDEQKSFAGRIAERTSQPENYHRAAGFHAGYMAGLGHRLTVEEIVDIISQNCSEDEDGRTWVEGNDFHSLAETIHRLLVGEEGE